MLRTVWTLLKRFFSKYFTLSIWRWGIQAIVCALITSLLVVVPQLNTLFHGTGYWAVSSAVVVLEGTTGGSVKKCIERMGGTFVGGIAAWGLFALVTWNETLTYTTYGRIVLWIVVCLFPLPWGYVRVKWPRNVLISVYGTMTGYIVLISAYLKGDAFFLAMLRIVAVALGVLVATIVVHVVFPLRARVEIKRGFADILTSMADILEPLLEASAGLTPFEMLNVLQPVKDKLKDIALKKHELHEKRDRQQKKIDSIKSRESSLAELPELDDSKQRTRVGNIVKKLSYSFTGLFRQDTGETGLRTVVRTETMPTNISTQPREQQLQPDLSLKDQTANDIDLQLPTLPFRKDPVYGTDHPSSPIVTPNVSPRRSRSSSPGIRSSADFNEIDFQMPMLQRKEARNSDPAPPQDSFHENSPASEIASSSNKNPPVEFDINWRQWMESNILNQSTFPSNYSEFFREQSLQLDVLKAKALQDVTTELTLSLEQEEQQRKERWARSMTQFEKCQNLLSAQSALLVEARQEISVRGPTVFPSEKYQAALTHIQALFHHIASLFFSLDLQLAQVARARRRSFTTLHLKKTEKEHFNYLSRVGFSPFEDLQITEDPETQKRIYAGMTAALENTEVFGHIIVEAVVNIRDALKGLAASVWLGAPIEDPLEFIEAAAHAISVLNDLRKERSEIISKIFTSAMISEQKGKWIAPFPDIRPMDNRPTTIAHPWETLMGIEPHVFHEMKKQEHEAYWKNFWKSRDRLSVTNGTLILLRDQLYVLCEVIEAISQHQQKHQPDSQNEVDVKTQF